jgi:hypothetical protein
LAELVWRELPLYFAHFGETEAAYLEELKAESPNADALRLFNQEILPTFDIRPELPRISAPTLVITGTEDFICGPLSASEIAGSITDVQTRLVPGAGQFVFPRVRFSRWFSRTRSGFHTFSPATRPLRSLWLNAPQLSCWGTGGRSGSAALGTGE